MTAEPTFSLDLSVSQVNTILLALNEAPYRISAPVIATILEQASARQNPSVSPTTSPCPSATAPES